MCVFVVMLMFGVCFVQMLGGDIVFMSVNDSDVCKWNQDVGIIIYIFGYGYFVSVGQFDVFFVEELGYFDDLCFDVEINVFGVNGQQFVVLGQVQFIVFGFVFDVMLVVVNSKNFMVVVIYGIILLFFIFGNEKFESFKDFEGGFFGYFINLILIVLVMFDEVGVDVLKVEMVKMINYDLIVVVCEQVDVIVGYVLNQFQLFKVQGLLFSEFFFFDFGVEGIYNVMEVNFWFFDEYCEVVVDFMCVSFKVFQYCFDEFDVCIDKFVKLVEDSGQGVVFLCEQFVCMWEVEFVWVCESVGGNFGVQNEFMWEFEYVFVKEYGDVKELFVIIDMMDVDLVVDFYDGDILIWQEK